MDRICNDAKIMSRDWSWTMFNKSDNQVKMGGGGNLRCHGDSLSTGFLFIPAITHSLTAIDSPEVQAACRIPEAALSLHKICTSHNLRKICVTKQPFHTLGKNAPC